MNDQIAMWRGPFGDDYHARNKVSDNSDLVILRIEFWHDVLVCPFYGERRIESILEVGAGSGTNLVALSEVTNAKFFGLEPNKVAQKDLKSKCTLVEGYAQAINLADRSVDLVFTCGVLIHIPPADLPAAVDEMYRVSSKYIMCAEYFSPEPEMKKYRGLNNMLFKRDFGGFIWDRYPDLRLLDYGFAWKRTTGMDNLTWWLFEKENT